MSAYWAVGGQAMLSTIGGWPEELARRGGAGAVAVGLLAAGLKLAGALLALVVVHSSGRRLPQRPLWGLAAVASGILVLYGGVLVTAGALVLTGVRSTQQGRSIRPHCAGKMPPSPDAVPNGQSSRHGLVGMSDRRAWQLRGAISGPLPNPGE